MKKILFVHDVQEDPTLRKSHLESVGFQVTACETADDCLAKMNEQKFDLVLMDILLKGLNGFDLTRQLRARHSPEDLPILLGCSIYRQRIHREEAYAAGAQGYILRPVDLEELVRDMRTLIGISESLVSAREAS